MHAFQGLVYSHWVTFFLYNSFEEVFTRKVTIYKLNENRKNMFKVHSQNFFCQQILSRLRLALKSNFKAHISSKN